MFGVFPRARVGFVVSEGWKSAHGFSHTYFSRTYFSHTYFSYTCFGFAFY